MRAARHKIKPSIFKDTCRQFVNHGNKKVERPRFYTESLNLVMSFFSRFEIATLDMLKTSPISSIVMS